MTSYELKNHLKGKISHLTEVMSSVSLFLDCSFTQSLTAVCSPIFSCSLTCRLAHVIFNSPVSLHMNLRHDPIIVELKKKKIPAESPPGLSGTAASSSFLSPQLRNVAANLCVDSKHGATGTELRLDVCVKDGSERTWSHEQVRAGTGGGGLVQAGDGVGIGL